MSVWGSATIEYEQALRIQMNDGSTDQPPNRASHLLRVK